MEGFDSSYSKKIGVLGWSFKKNTNDSRESASIYVDVLSVSLLESKSPGGDI